MGTSFSASPPFTIKYNNKVALAVFQFIPKNNLHRRGEMTTYKEEGLWELADAYIFHEICT
jgi:hypothetical protein